VSRPRRNVRLWEGFWAAALQMARLFSHRPTSCDGKVYERRALKSQFISAHQVPERLRRPSCQDFSRSKDEGPALLRKPSFRVRPKAAWRREAGRAAAFGWIVLQKSPRGFLRPEMRQRFAVISRRLDIGFLYIAPSVGETKPAIMAAGTFSTQSVEPGHWSSAPPQTLADPPDDRFLSSVPVDCLTWWSARDTGPAVTKS